MRQYRDGLSDGSVTEKDIEKLAIRRLLDDDSDDSSEPPVQRMSPEPPLPALSQIAIEDYDEALAREYLEFAPHLLSSKAAVAESRDPAAFIRRIEGKVAFLEEKFDLR